MSASEKSKSQDSDKTGEEAGRYSAMTVKEILTALDTEVGKSTARITTSGRRYLAGHSAELIKNMDRFSDYR